MSRSIFKYEIVPQNISHASIEVPHGTEILSAAFQGDEPARSEPPQLYFWALVDPEEQRSQFVDLNVIGTGWPLNGGKELLGEFLGTVHSVKLGMVFHIFYKITEYGVPKHG